MGITYVPWHLLNVSFNSLNNLAKYVVLSSLLPVKYLRFESYVTCPRLVGFLGHGCNFSDPNLFFLKCDMLKLEKNFVSS